MVKLSFISIDPAEPEGPMREESEELDAYSRVVSGVAAALAPPPPVLGAVVAPLLEHAAKTTAATAISAANLRFAMLSIPPRWDLTDLSVPRVPR